MFKSILLPVDGSELSEKAVLAAIDFARDGRCRITGMTVVEPYPWSALAEPMFLPDPVKWERDNKELAQRNVDKLAEAAKAAGVQCETLIAEGDDPADEIVRVARERGCDGIFMASHGRRGLDRLVLGSVTQKVLLKSTLPVVVFR